MISGYVNARREALLSLMVRGPKGRERTVEAIIDTGFTGRITLPPDLIAALELPFVGRGSALLGDGSRIEYNSFEVIVVWDGKLRHVLVDEADTEPLVGMRLLSGHELAIEVAPGGSVSIRPLYLS